MATAKQGGKTAAARNSSNSARSAGSAQRKPSSSTRKSTTRSTAKRAKPAKRASSNRTTRASSNGRRGNEGVTDRIKQVANTAKGPAVAVGAAAAGIAGGLVIKSRTRRKTVLGVPVPRSLGKGMDPKSVAKSVGHASKQFAKTSKNVSKDLERAGNQAEKIGKILD